MSYSKSTKPMRWWKLVIIDVLVFGVSLLTFAYFHHVRKTDGGEGTVITMPGASTTSYQTQPNEAYNPWDDDPDEPWTGDDPDTSDTTTEDASSEIESGDPATTEEDPSAASQDSTPSSSEGSSSNNSSSATSSGSRQDTSSEGERYPVISLPESLKTVYDPDEDLSPYASLGMGAKFHDKFNLDGSITMTPTSYVSGRVAIYLGETEYNGAVCHVADIYLCDVADFRTCFADDTFGRGHTEKTRSMAARVNAVLAINGDYYGTHAKTFIVRNGRLYDNSNADDDICVLYADGRMVSYYESQFDSSYAVANGAWQAWSFGPKLLENGKALTHFNSTVAKHRNPRSALGYFEPGHYCFVAVDGRSEDSDGLTMSDLSKFFEGLGCADAYNLDGGKTTVMVFNGKYANVPYEGGRPCSDIVYIGDLTNGRGAQ